MSDYDRNSAERYRNYADILAHSHARADQLGLPGSPTQAEKEVMSTANQIENVTDANKQRQNLDNIKTEMEERKNNPEMGVIRPTQSQSVEEAGVIRPTENKLEEMGVIRPASSKSVQQEGKDDLKPQSQSETKKPEQSEIQPSDIKGFKVSTNAKGHDEYYHEDTGKLGFVDKGGEISVVSRKVSAVRGALDLAESKEWTPIEVDGKDNFKEVTAIHAKAKGIEVSNVELTPQQAREAKSIELQDRVAEIDSKAARDATYQQSQAKQGRENPSTDSRSQWDKYAQAKGRDFEMG